jgi:VCBS repeat-containing protein
LTVADVDDGQAHSVAASGNGASGLGSYTVDGDGNWAYTVDNTAVQHLAAGATAADSFVVSSVDGTASQTVTVTINGANDPASISGTSTGSLGEDDVAPATGTLTVADVDDGQAHSVAASGNGASGLGSYTVDGDGNWAYTVDNTAVQHLAAGATAADSFVISSVDGSASQTVTITINGANDPASITGTSTGSLGEDDVVPVTGTLTVADVDDGEAHSVAASGNGAAGLGSYTVDGDGNWAYTVDNTAVQHLAAGATAADSFVVSSVDGTASQTVTVTINGANDPASISGTSTGSLGEDDVVPVTGTLTVADVDDGQAHSVAASGNGAAGLGSYTVDGDGNWAYTVDNTAVQHLADGATATDSFVVSSVDGTASQTVTVTINGANDPASITGTSTGSLGEDDVTQATGTLTVADVDDGEAHSVAASGNGAAGLGSYTVDGAGHWAYTVNNAAVQYLNIGNTATDSFVVSSVDGTASQTVTITVNGANDPASISGPTTGSVTEAGSLNAGGTPVANGTLTDTDVDNSANTFLPAGPTTTAYGSYTMTTGGTWTYTLDNGNPTVDALNAGNTLADSFSVHTQDGTSQTINVTINGAYDDHGPPTGIFLSLNGNAGNAMNNLGTFIATGDPDVGDSFTWSAGAGSSAGFVVTGGVLNANAVAAGNSTLNLVVTDLGGNSFSQTYHVWIGTSGSNTEVFSAATTNNIGDGLAGADGITGGNGVDYILAGGGNDTIQGNGGADWLVGGNNSDTFIYAAQSDSNLSAFDTILDFTHNADTLAFKNALLLSTVSAADFGLATTLSAHTVGWHFDGTDTTVYANLGGGTESIASGADMMKIVLKGTTPTNLASGDINIHA